MLRQMEGESSVISHMSYLGLVQCLMEKIAANQRNSALFWSLVNLMTSILLLYKFSECAQYLMDAFMGTRDVASLFVLSRVFYDHASTLVERHDVLKVCIQSGAHLEEPVFWGLLATISLSAEGKKAIKGIGSSK